MLNQVCLIGRLTDDVDVRFTPNGKAVGNFSLALERPSADTEKVDYPDIVVWGKQAENCAEYIGKGSLVGIKGSIQTRKYEDEKNNVTRYVTEVVAQQVKFLDWRKKNKEEQAND